MENKSLGKQEASEREENALSFGSGQRLKDMHTVLVILTMFRFATHNFLMDTNDVSRVCPVICVFLLMYHKKLTPLK